MHTSADGNKDKPIYGFMRGIVIKNSDPMNRGRVKIFLPMLARQLLTSQGGEGAEWSLRFLGDKILSDSVLDANQAADAFVAAAQSPQKIPDDQLHRIAGVLDWVEQASPLVGSGTIGVYDATNKMADISDAPFTTDLAVKEGTASPGRTPRISAIDKNPLSSSVEYDKKSIGTGQVDMHSFNRPTAGYINSAKGMFSVPRVGAHVWVFFEGGDITRPVYFAYSYGQAEWSSIQVQNQENPDIHTPSVGLKENDPQSSGIHTGKTVWNEKGGLIEFINTDDFESVKIADFHGSHITMDKLGISESTAPNKGKKLEVNGDYYVDVKGNYILRIQGERQTIMQGYDHVIHGNLGDTELQQQWLDTAAPVMKNAAIRPALPNFEFAQEEIHNSSIKMAPNNDFEMSVSLDFKVPPGKTISMLNDSVKNTLKTVTGATNLAVKSMTDVVGEAQGAIAGVTGAITGAAVAVKNGVNNLVSGAKNMLTGALGKAAETLNDKMHLSTAQLGDPLKTLGISLKKIQIPTLLALPALPPFPKIPVFPRVTIKVGGNAVSSPTTGASTNFASSSPGAAPTPQASPAAPPTPAPAATPAAKPAPTPAPAPTGSKPATSAATTTSTTDRASTAPPFKHDAKTQQILRIRGFVPELTYPDTAARIVATYERGAQTGKEMKAQGQQKMRDGVPLNGKDSTGHTFKNGYMVD